MNLMAAVDDTGGMLFNGRRQSMDRNMREKILECSGKGPLYVSPYTAQMFSPEQQKKLHVSENFLAEAKKGDWAWTEKTDPAPYEKNIEKIFLFHWNRTYPADTWFSLDLKNWHLEKTEEFPGSSHDKITLEVYGR